MDVLDRARRTWRTIRHRDRRRWRSDSRVHLETRPVPANLSESFAAAAQAALATVPDVRWGRFNAVLGVLVVDLAPSADERTDGRIAAVLADLEDRFGIADAPFADDHAAKHPGDDEPRIRTEVEIGVDLVALAVGLAMRLSGRRTIPAELDLAALVTAVEGIPEARRILEGKLGRGTTELALNLGKAISSALLQGAVGPSVDAARRVLRLRELEARALAFASREAALCREPDAHPATRPDVGERPVPLPKGPIERYSEKAVFASLGGAGFGLASSQSLEGAAAGIFGGIPRPAYLGREAFASWLGMVLGKRGVVVLQRDALRRLDRVDVVLIEGSLFATPHPDVDALVTGAKRAGLAVHRSGRAIAAGAAGVRALQLRGHAVLYIGTDDGALSASDVGVGLPRDGQVPFSADLLCTDDLVDARLVVDATRAARDASRQAVQMAGVELATSVLLSLGGLQQNTVRRVMIAAHATQVLAMGNGIRLAEQLARPLSRGYHPPSVGWHAESPDDVLSQLESSLAGLDPAVVEARRPPTLAAKSRARQLGDLVVDELTNPLTPILVAGAGLSALMGGLTDAAMVGGVLGLNTALGVSQRYRTEKALQSLFADEQRHVRVRRSGAITRVRASELVVGDLVELDAGEVVPADGRLVEAHGLELDEASLTGESLPVAKDLAPVDPSAPVADRRSMLFAGTAVAAGSATFVVTAIGDATEAERGLLDVDEAPAGGVEARLESLTAFTAPLAAAAGVAVILAGLARKKASPNEIVSAGVSLAVAAVPEGLPLLATSAQLAAAKRLSQRGAIVRNPRAIEALGRVDVLCADKTGTLTQGKLRVQLVHDGSHEAPPDALDESLRSTLRVALRATPPRDTAGALPHPTDQALVDAGVAAGLDVHEALRIRDELPFEPARGYHALREHTGRVHLKGAPEVIAARCDRWSVDGADRPLDPEAREELHRAAASLADRGLRVLAIADGQLDQGELTDETMHGLRFRGLVGIADPVRATAERALDDLRRAGVTTIMITGDHPRTAGAIARELKLDGETPRVVTGPELEAATDAELVAMLASVRVFARVTPSQKVRIVKALKTDGRVVAMTGDGANDAQAIRLADVGIALGGASTGAARHAADLVVADGSVESIVAAVLEGRALWRSVREAVSLLVGGNLGEIGFTLTGGLLGGRSPLNARQLLLVNLLTDALPAMAVALRPPSSVTPEELLREGPEVSLGDALERDILERGVITGSAATLAWLVARASGDRRGADTVGLLALVGAQLGQTLVAGGRSPLVIATGVGSLAALVALIETPPTSLFFGSRPLGPVGLAQAAGAAGLATVASWAWPKIRDRLAASKGAPPAEVGPIERAKQAWARMRESAATTAATSTGTETSREP